MICSKAQRLIPELWINDLNFRRRADIELHLSGCSYCRTWYVIWQNIRLLGQDQFILPKSLNWDPFHQAIENELQHSASVKSAASRLKYLQA